MDGARQRAGSGQGLRAGREIAGVSRRPNTASERRAIASNRPCRSSSVRTNCARRVAAWRRDGERVAFVPTMGNLHAGHGSLVERARAACRSRGRQHLRQSAAVRAERGLRRVSAHAGGRSARCWSRCTSTCCSCRRSRTSIRAGRKRRRACTCRCSKTSCAARSGPGISWASRPWSRSCSTSCSRTSRCSARRTSSS